MSNSEIQTEGDVQHDMNADKVKGLIQLDAYRGSSLSLDGFAFTRVLDDIIMAQYTDSGETENEVVRGGIIVPIGVMQKNQVWRVAKVLLAGPRASVKPGEFVVFPNDKGLPVAKMGQLKNLVFLNEQRIFGVVSPE
jgi:hypothetical protein